MCLSIANYFTAPGIPGDLFVNEINSTVIVVTWVQPAVTNGIITMYEVFYSLGNHTVLDENATVVPINATVSISYEIIIDELDPFTIYTVAVRAFTRIGAGNLTETFSILTDPDSKLFMSYIILNSSIYRYLVYFWNMFKNIMSHDIGQLKLYYFLEII